MLRMAFFVGIGYMLYTSYMADKAANAPAGGGGAPSGGGMFGRPGGDGGQGGGGTGGGGGRPAGGGAQGNVRGLH